MIVGAGWIGLEVAAAARHHGNAVTVVEPQPTPLHAVLGAEMGQVFARLHREPRRRPVHRHRRCASSGGAAGRVESVVTDAHAGLPADVVVVGVGAIPNTGLAASAGLEVDNGVVTDHALRTSAPDVFAAGDVAAAFHPLYGRHVRVEHWANALNQGPAAARSMLGQDVSYDRVPYFFTDQYDLGMEYSGLAGPRRHGGLPRQPGRRRVHRLLDGGRPGHRGHERQRLGRHRADPAADPLAAAGAGRRGSPTRTRPLERLAA